MANQVTVSNNNTINVTVEPPANVQVQVSRTVIGTVANVENADLANYVVQPNQSNITSVGTLTGLTSSGNVTAPFFIGNVVGNISGNIVVPGSNTAVLYNNQGNAGASDALTFNYSSNVLTANGNIVANYFIGNGSQLTDIVAVDSNHANYANIANVANSVAVANVVGIGNIAVINLDGNLSNILYGNGVFAQVPNVSNVANANYANYAGNVTVSAQPNITSLGVLTGLVVGGNITPNANVTYDLGNNTNRFNDLYLAGNTIYLGAQELSANATGMSFTGNLSGNATGLSNITGANVTGQVGNALVASTVYTNAQPNITSVGNLTSLTVSGDAGIAGNLSVGGNLTYINVTNLVVQDPVIEMGGGPNGAPLTTNDGKDRGSLLHYYTTQPVDAFMGWDNSNGEFAFGSNVTNNNDVMTFNQLGNVRAQTFIGNLTGLASSATVAASANSVAGANVTGQVAYAAVANSVAGANVSGAVAYATTANSVAVANVSGIGNIATVNLDGNVANLLTGTGTWVAIPTVSSNANYANFAGTVITNAQPNITSVGTLTSLAVAGNITGVDVLAMDTSNGTGTLTAGQLSWDVAEQTLSLGMNNGVTQQIGLESYILVKASATITDGQVVMFTGANGNNVTAAPADVTSVGFRAGYILGVATQSIATNGTGYITTFGQVHGLNTNAYTVGDLLWLDPTTPGGLTVTQPSAPNYQIQIATVTKKSAGDGHIQVIIRPEPQLKDISDVTITTPSAGQSLVYNGSNVWINGNSAYANTAGTVTTNAQPNITSVGTLSSLSVTGNATFANSIILSSTSAINDITGVDNGSNANQRGLRITGGTVDSGNSTSGNSAGTVTVNGGNSYSNTDTGAVWNATGGILQFNSGSAYTANGNATSQQITLSTGSAQTDKTGRAVAGSITISGGGALADGNTANTGDITIRTGAATTTTSGTARSGNIDLQIGATNGATGNTIGNINIGTASNVLYGSPTSITIGQANTPTIIGGVANITGNLNALSNSNLGNVGNVKITGGSANYILSTDGAGNLDWVAQTDSANANFANFAGNVTVSAQPNITTTGNLLYLNVRDSSNTIGVVTQFLPNSNVVINPNFSNNNTSFQITTQYWPNNSVGYPATSTVIRSRGNASAPTTTASGDRVAQHRYSVYNGNTYPTIGSETWTLTPGGTLNSNADQAYAGGQWNIFTANPTGNLANGSALNAQSSLAFTSSGSLQITPGAPANSSLGQASSSLLLTNYGATTANLVQAGGLNFQRARGDRDGVLTVQPGDQVGRSVFVPYSNGAYQSTNVAQYTVTVDSSYVANDVVVPMSHNFTTVANVGGVATFRTTRFYANGVASFPGDITTTSTANVGALNVTGTTNLNDVGNVIITGGTANYVLSTNGSGNLSWVAQSGGGGTPGGSNTQLQFNDNGVFGGISTVTWNGSNISLGAVGNVKVTGGVNNEVIRTDGAGNLSFSSIAQTLLVGTRAGPYTVPITNYTFEVTTRTSGNVTVYVN